MAGGKHLWGSKVALTPPSDRVWQHEVQIHKTKEKPHVAPQDPVIPAELPPLQGTWGYSPPRKNPLCKPTTVRQRCSTNLVKSKIVLNCMRGVKYQSFRCHHQHKAIECLGERGDQQVHATLTSPFSSRMASSILLGH